MKRRKRRKKRQILPESVPEKHSPSGAKESDFTLANAMTQWLYSTKDRIVKILSFCDLNTKMVESGNIPAQGLFASFEPLKFWTENAENN